MPHLCPPSEFHEASVKMSRMNDWIARHAWPIGITLVGVIASFSLYGYRLDVVEKKVDTLQVDSVANQVLLAEIKKDIEYIRFQVTKLAP